MAISSSTPGRAALRPLAATITYYAAFIGLGMVSASLGPTLSGLADQTQTDLSEVSFLFSTRATGYLLGSLLGGRLYDRMPGNPVMAGALLLMALGAIFAPTLPILVGVAAVLLLIGVGEGTVDVGGNALLVWVHRARVGPYMNALHLFFGLGAFLSPIVIAYMVAASGGIRWAYWVLALYVIPVAWWLTREPSPLPEVHQDAGRPATVNWPLVGLVALFMFLYVSAEVAFGGWIYTYAIASGLADTTTAGYLNSLYWGGLTLGRLAAIWIAMHWRPRMMLLIDLIGSLVSLGLIVALPHAAWALWVGSFAFGLALASIFPTVITWSERRMTVSGAVTSAFLVGASLGGVFLPWLIGQYFETAGPRSAMVFILAAMLVSCGVFAVLMVYGGPPKAKESHVAAEVAPGA